LFTEDVTAGVPAKHLPVCSTLLL